jgi:hypothetical protein
LSSTSKDLGPYREAVYRMIERLVYHCVRMEEIGAHDWSADEFCRAAVAAGSKIVIPTC